MADNNVNVKCHEESIISVRRTSPVDLNLGDDLVLDHHHHHHQSAPPLAKKRSFRNNSRNNSAPKIITMTTDPQVIATDPGDHSEELGALRNLTSELHTALRLSEAENAALRGNALYVYSRRGRYFFSFRQQK